MLSAMLKQLVFPAAVTGALSDRIIRKLDATGIPIARIAWLRT